MQEAGDYRRLDRFDAVEATGEAELFQTFLEQVDRIADVSARRRRSFALVGARPGSHLVDVGCGLGTAAREMAALVAPGGSVIGVDVSDSMVSAAEERTPLGTAEVTFRVGDATSLPIEDGELTGYRAERLYQHLSRPDLALAEASRVLATGGRLVLVDQDWDCLAFDSDDRTTTRAVIRAFADSLVDGWIGRRYHALLVDAGFVDIDVIAETVASADYATYGFVTTLVARSAVDQDSVSSDVAERWLNEQRQRAEAGRWFMAMTHYLAAATRS
jgi:ubiquinone/menaquinone biosynthesis C-methylase UbiE